MNKQVIYMNNENKTNINCEKWANAKPSIKARK